MSRARRNRRIAAARLKKQTAKHGTMYDRIAATIHELIRRVAIDDLPVENHLALYGHPKSIRALAICFTSALSKAEIEFLPPGGPGPHYTWRTIPVFELSDQPDDRIVLRWHGDPIFDFMLEGPARISEHTPSDGHGEARRRSAIEVLKALG